MSKRSRGRNKKLIASESETITIEDSDNICTVCHAEFIDLEDLQLHITQAHPKTPPKRYYCNFCTDSSACVEGYLTHIIHSHLPFLHFCSFCRRGFLDAKNLNEHEALHKSVNSKLRYSCSHCRVLFDNKQVLEMHEYEQHKDGNGLMLQGYYPHFSSLLNVRAETFFQNDKQNASITCHVCQYTNGNILMYVNHLKKKKCKSYSCNNCCKVFATKNRMAVHMRSCSSEEKKHTKKCPVCRKSFNIPEFQLHKSHCKIIKCYRCDIVFNAMDELTKHQNMEHPSAAVLKRCRYCDIEHVRSLPLYKHMLKRHTDYKDYKYCCVHCDLLFKHPQKLFTHIDRKHINIHPFTCKICDMQFRIRKKFSLHIKLKHQSQGFVEYDKEFNVFFAAEKSDNPCCNPPLTENSELFNDEELLDYNLLKEMEECRVADRKPKKTSKTTKKTEVKVDNETDIDQTTDVGNESDKAETDGNSKKTSVVRRTRRAIKRKVEMKESELSSDDEPLVKKKTPSNYKTGKPVSVFCSVCNKNCFTVQNYHRHISMHSQNERKQCVKCNKFFNYNKELTDHMQSEHASSNLTNTLRSILERRKNGSTNESISAKFLKTIRKVEIPKADTGPALIKKTSHSVRNFIETFLPDDGKSNVNDSYITISEIIIPSQTKNLIRMTKFQEHSINTEKRLKYPQRFTKVYNESHSVTIKLVHEDRKPNRIKLEEPAPQTPMYDDYHEDQGADSDGSHQFSSIPEVAEEVMLENTEEIMAPKHLHMPQKLDLPQLQKQFKSKYKKVKVGHLVPEAPFFKISTVNDIINQDEKKNEKLQAPKEEIIELPEGLTYVPSNPLAHLMDKPVDKIIPGKKYYNNKIGESNINKVLKLALLKLKHPELVPKKYSRKKSVQVEQ